MGLPATPYLQVRGSHDLILEFWDPLHISGTTEARNLKFGMQMEPEGQGRSQGGAGGC